MTAFENRGCGTYSSALFFRMLIACIVAGIFLCVRLMADESEIRGLWVVRDAVTSWDKARELVDIAESCGINTLFFQVRGRGDAYYRSYFVPGPEKYPHIPNEFDPLEAIVNLAHNRGIAVHAWFNMYLTWSADNPPQNPVHIVNAHPGWFMVSRDGISMADTHIDSVRNGYSEGRFISPAFEEVRSYLSRVITEVLVNYDIDGVHLDYIRYPGRNHDFSHRIRNRFISMYGVDPVDVVINGDTVDPTVEYLQKWIEFKAEQVNDQISSIARRITIVDRNVKLSAAVKPSGIEAYYEFGQDWIEWLNSDIVDFVVSMSYFPDDNIIREKLKDSLVEVDPKKIIGGIGLYKIDPGSAARQIGLMRSLGLAGFSLFSYSSILEDRRYIDTLKQCVEEFSGYNKPEHDLQPGLEKE